MANPGRQRFGLENISYRDGWKIASGSLALVRTLRKRLIFKKKTRFDMILSIPHLVAMDHG